MVRAGEAPPLNPHRRSAVRLLIALSVAGASAIAPPLPLAAEVTCQVLGQVNFRGLEVRPETPVVGSDVELHFDVDLFVYSVTRLSLQGAAPFLVGTTSTTSSSDATFRLTAAQAGRAMVQLVVTYGTEEQCTDSDTGYTYFQLGPDRTATSPAYTVDVTDQAPACTGDCNGDGQVSISELMTGVGIALGAPVSACPAVDCNADGHVTVQCLVSAVQFALAGCTSCGGAICSPGEICCNPLLGICSTPGTVCIQ